MNRYRWTAVLAAVVATGLPATAAAAESGWKLPMVTSQDGDRTFTSVAWHCGATQFGTYRFKNGVSMPGRRGHVVFRVKLTEDGRGHKAKFDRFGGRLPRGLRTQTRDALRRARYRYRAGQQPLVESVWPDGSLQASRPFNPVPVDRARC